MIVIVKEFFEIIEDFYKMRKNVKSEKFLLLGVPVLGAALTYLLGILLTATYPIKILDLTDDFINQFITLLTLFISFSIAYIGMIISSESEAVNNMKEADSKVYSLNGKQVKVFQVIHCLMTYTVAVEVIFLVLAFAEKIFINFINDSLIKIVFCFNIALLLHIVILICIQIKEIYFSFWKV